MVTSYGLGINQTQNLAWNLGARSPLDGGGFAPTSLSGLVAWYDAATTSTGAVASWTDKSGNGNNATQGTGSAQPTCTANQLSGLNTLLFDGGDSLTLPSGLYSLANGDNTCFVVSKRNTETGSAEYDWSLTEGGSVRHYSRFSATAGNNLYLNATVTTGGVSISGGTNTSYQIKSMFKSSTTLSIQINNATATTNTNGANENGIDGGSIGALAGSGFLTGGIGEIIMYNRALTAAEIVSINRYLSGKWGITIA